MEYKPYCAAIRYEVERVKRFLIWELVYQETMDYAYPVVMLAPSADIAKNLFKLSDFWRNNEKENDEFKGCEVINKEAFVEEMKDESILFYMDTMKAEDFLVYLRQLQETVA